MDGLMDGWINGQLALEVESETRAARSFWLALLDGVFYSAAERESWAGR